MQIFDHWSCGSYPALRSIQIPSTGCASWTHVTYHRKSDTARCVASLSLTRPSAGSPSNQCACLMNAVSPLGLSKQFPCKQCFHLTTNIRHAKVMQNIHVNVPYQLPNYVCIRSEKNTCLFLQLCSTTCMLNIYMPLPQLTFFVYSRFLKNSFKKYFQYELTCMTQHYEAFFYFLTISG